MVISRTANQPIKFSGQIVAYGAGVADTSQSSIVVDTSNIPIKFSQAIVRYTPSTGTPVKYTPV